MTSAHSLKVIEKRVLTPSSVELSFQLPQEFLKDYAFQAGQYLTLAHQIEGKEVIHRLVTGVTACQALIDQAIEVGADAILVHHGFFWRSEDPVVVGMKARRLRALMLSDINLFAYHLPLDCHPELGNNAQLGRLMGISKATHLASSDSSIPVFCGELTEAMPISSFVEHLSSQLGRELLTVGEGAVKKSHGVPGQDNTISTRLPRRVWTYM